MREKIIYFVTKGNYGGAQKYVFDLATSLDERFYDILVVSGEGNDLPKMLKTSKSNIGIKTLSQSRRDINPFRDFILLLKILYIIFKERPDIIHLNSPKISGLAAFCGRILFVPKIIYTVHGWTFNEKSKKNILTKFFSWLTVFFSTKTILINQADYSVSEPWPFVKNKLVLIYNGVSNIEFLNQEQARASLRDLLKLPRSSNWIGTIAELHPNKGLSYLIKAFSKIPDAVLIIFGEGEERESLEMLIQNLNLNQRVRLTGFVPKAPKFLKAFNTFVLPSLKEGHPYALLEAGLAQRAVIGTDIPGTRDILRNDCGLLVKPEDVKGLSEAMKEVLLDRELQNRLGANLFKKVKDDFSFQKMFSKTTALYSD